MRRGGGGHYILLFAAKESSTLHAKNGAAAAWQEWRRTHECCQAAGLRARVFAHTRRRQLAMARIAGALDLRTQCREASHKRSRRRSVEVW